MIIFLKFVIIMIIVVASAANVVHNYIKAIDDVVAVQKSNTCVVLVIDGTIQFVTTEKNAHKELVDYGNIARNKNLHVRETFEPLATMDVVEKLSKIGRTRSTFLIYFRANLPQPRVPEHTVPHRPPLSNGNKHHHHGGLLGLAENAFGLKPIIQHVLTPHKL